MIEQQNRVFCNRDIRKQERRASIRLKGKAVTDSCALMLDIQLKSNQWEVKRASDPGSVLLFRPALLGKTGISLQLQPRVCHVTCLTYLIISSWPCALNIGAADAEHLFLRPLILWYRSLYCGKPSIIHL